MESLLALEWVSPFYEISFQEDQRKEKKVFSSLGKNLNLAEQQSVLLRCPLGGLMMSGGPHCQSRPHGLLKEVLFQM